MTPRLLPRHLRVAQWIFATLVGSASSREILEDLAEEYWRFVRPARGPSGAGRWYWRQIVRSIGPARGTRRHRRRRTSLFGDTLRDLRHGWRNLRRSPGFSCVAVGTLGLGIGASTAIFSIVNAVLLRPLPYPESHRLAQLWNGSTLSNEVVDRVREETRSFEGITGYYELPGNLSGVGDPTELLGAAVAPRHFAILGAAPGLGRVFLPGEERPGQDQVVVLSHRLWRERFASDSTVLGRRVDLAGSGRTIVGVMPDHYHPVVRGAVFWIPLTIDRSDYTSYSGLARTLLVARLRPGITVGQATQDLRAVATRLREETGNAYDETWVTNAAVRPLREALVAEVRPALWAVFGAVGFVLAIVCANVANLVLARGAARAREMAIRMGLGAGRGRVVRQLLTENALLGVLGGVAGLAVAAAVLRTLAGALPRELTSTTAVTIDGWVLGFAVAISLVSVGLFGLAPAVRVSGMRPHDTLRSGSRGTGADRRHHRLNRLLVTGQIALSVVLVTGAGLMLRSFVAIRQVDLGFEPRPVITMRVRLPESSRYAEDQARVRFFDEVDTRVEALPGVSTAGFVGFLPMATGMPATTYRMPDRPIPDDQPPPFANFQLITPGYFEVMGIPIVRGRDLAPSDHATAPTVAVINRALAREAWGETDPIGKTMIMFGGGAEFTVVGVVGDTHQHRPDADPRPEAYFTFAQQSWNRAMVLTARVAGDPVDAVAAIQRAVWSVDPGVPIAEVRTMPEVVDAAISDTRFFTAIITGFGAMALGLAAVGVYGVLSFIVSQRTREFGIRVALGADRHRVVRESLRSAMEPAAVGIVLGVVGAYAGTRILSGLLFGVHARDPLTFAMVPTLLIAVAALAGFLPARHAAAGDPAGALKPD